MLKEFNIEGDQAEFDVQACVVKPVPFVLISSFPFSH